MDTYVVIAISVLAALILTAVVCIKRRLPERKESGTKTSDVDSLVPDAVNLGRNVVCKALDALAVNDVTEVCRIQRQGAESLYDMGKKVDSLPQDTDTPEGLKAVYMRYMLEAADKVAETSRNIATRPGHAMPTADKCEIQTIRKYICQMLAADTSCNATTPVSAADNMDFLEHVIAERTKEMSYGDFDDDSYKYSYLMLLYYLHSFVNSFYRIVAASQKSLTEK